MKKQWRSSPAVNQPAELAEVLRRLEIRQKEFNTAQSGGKHLSHADLIVLAGGVAIETAAEQAGRTLSVPFYPGRTDAVQAHTDVASFAVPEPKADGCRNYAQRGYESAAASRGTTAPHALRCSLPSCFGSRSLSRAAGLVACERRRVR
jgi:catalase-peroxidase